MVTELDEGELLVIRRALNKQKSPKDEQRENIFHKRHTINSSVYSLIIGSGSCANVASTSLIEKLGLQTVHPYPYNIHWLNQRKGLQVHSRCLLSLLVRATLMRFGVT